MDFGLTLDIGIILAIVTLILELRSQQKSSRELAEREQKRAQVEIYQRLELASSELHRFEADHLELIRPLYTGKNAPTEPAQSHVYSNYVSQILNLFEMQIELFCNGLVDRDNLDTWLPWFNELGLAPGFRAVWTDGVSDNYSRRLRRVLDKILELERNLESAELLEILESSRVGAK